MTYTPTQLEALQRALASAERRIGFGDKSVEYRSVEELQAAIRAVEAAQAREQARAKSGAGKRQIRVTTDKGF